MRSIRGRLSALALAAVALAWLAAAAFTYLDAREEIDELLDAHLAQAAALLVAQASHELEEIDTDDAGEQKYSREVAFQVWEDGRKLRLRSANAPAEPLGARETGFSDRVVEGVRWRVYSTWSHGRDYLIQVGERASVREALAGQIAKNLLRPLVFALPFLALLLWIAIGRGLKPLAGLARDVGRRDPANLGPLDAARAPREVLPLVEQLNRLFARVAESIEKERSFTADAAHELRTPIAAIKAQAQVAQGAETDAERGRAIEQAIRGCDRAAHLVEQLLTLARLDAPEQLAKRPCALQALAGEAVAELTPAASETGVRLELATRGDVDAAGAETTGARGGASAPVRGELEVAGSADLLRVLLRNLVDNAVRYSPPGTAVRVGAERVGGRPCLFVADEGPGIPDADRDKVVRRFHRGLGTGKAGAGLGLSIAHRIAELHGAELVLSAGDGGRGLRASVLFPA
ncbi:MAG TPA: ATP-binding protein [Gammaproteobacteria bacterium]|nr:ATP-binding protein [Gammaproteobacteria bacterium]